MYAREIFRVLAEAGEDGLSVQKTALHVFNACNSFFNEVSLDEVRAYVSRFLAANSRNPNSMVERTQTRGVYHLNLRSRQTQQLMLQFEDERTEEQDKESRPAAEDRSLSLFDEAPFR